MSDLAQRMHSAIESGKKSKPVLLKKNILDKNKEHHPDLSAEDNRKILDAALYHAEEIINDKPSAKPNYWVLAKIDGKSSIVTIEISETKDAHEIVGWHFANEKAMDKIRNRANREGGQVLITKSNAQGSSDLYDLPADTTNTIPSVSEKSSAEDKKTPTLSDKIRKKPEKSEVSEKSDKDEKIEDEDTDSDLKLSAPGDRVSGTFTEDDGTEIKFSLRNDRPPQKTKTGYKVFAVFKSKPGELFPPMVANPGGESTPTGVWLNTDAAPRAEDSKTGRPKVQAGGKGTNAGKQTLAYRPGWHLGEVPQAKQFNRLNKQTMKKDLFPENFVWAECEFAADVDYQKEAESYGYNAKGNFQYSLAGLPKIPVDGYYKYRTNPDPGTEPWFITGAMRVKRLLTDTEVNKILKDNGYPEMKRQGGEIDLFAWGFDTTDFETIDGELKLSTPADILKQSNDLDISQMVLTQKATTQTEALKNLERLAGRDIKNRETGIDAQINSTQRNKLVSKVALSKSKDNGFSFEDHFTAVANIDQLFENGSMVDDRPDKDGDPNVLSVKRFSAPLLLGDEFAEAYITVKETVGNKIYSIELDEIKKPSDITGGTLKERYHIPEGYNNLLQKIEKARELLKKSENFELKLSTPGDFGDTSLNPVDYRRGKATATQRQTCRCEVSRTPVGRA